MRFYFYPVITFSNGLMKHPEKCLAFDITFEAEYALNKPVNLRIPEYLAQDRVQKE